MPGGKRKLKGGGYRVRWGGKTRAKKTTKRKAEAQLRILKDAEKNKRKGKRCGKRKR